MPRKIKQKTRKIRSYKKKNIKIRTRNSRKRKTRTRKWSRKYKKSINCQRPKGFSQKQYCKYGRK